MLEPTAVTVLWCRCWYSDECDAMMLLVVGDESDCFVTMGDSTAEECQVEVLHELQVCGSQYDMCESRGGDYLGSSVVEVRHDHCHLWISECPNRSRLEPLRIELI